MYGFVNQIPHYFAPVPGFVALFGGAAQATQEAWKWLEFTGLQGKANDLPDNLNLHQRKFLELARALASRPRLVLLDEVPSGLTPGEINEAIALIRKIRERGATIVFVEHVMRAVMAMATRAYVMEEGRIVAQGQASELSRRPEIRKAYLGLEVRE